MTKDNSQFTEEFLKEAGRHKTLQSMGDVVGLPDEEDKLRIQLKLRAYEKEHPGELAFIINMAREHFKDAGGDKQKYGLTNKQASGRTLFELPEDLGRWLENAYPLMFRERKHTAWFAKNFPELLIPEVY